jgi:AraC-like DNA-binding protein
MEMLVMENTIAASIALVAWRLMELYGENPVEYAEAKGLSREQLEDSRFRMSYQDCDDLWRCAERVINDPCAGLKVPSLWHPATFGVLGYSMLSSSTLRIALERLERYQKVVSDVSSIELSPTDKGFLLRQNNLHHLSGDFPMAVDASFSTWLHICRFNYGEALDPVEVNLMRPKPDCAGEYYAFFRCPVNFSVAHNNIVLPHEAMDVPLSSGNKELAQMYDRVMQVYLNEQQRSELASKVHESIVSHLPSGELTKEIVAKELCMSTRTLQRRLVDEGTNYADILNETRRELALRYIKDDSLPLIEVSFLLGFSDSAAFSRAFKRWTGQTPSELKEMTH